MVTRRGYLAGLGAAGVSQSPGCLDSFVLGGDPTPGREAVLAYVADAPEGSPLAYDVELLEAAFHGDETPTLRLTIENETDREVEVMYTPDGWDRAGFFDTMKSDPRGLAIGTVEELDDLWMEERGCPFARYGSEATPDSEATRILQPSATDEWELSVVGDIDHVDGECPPTDVYQFSAYVAVGDGPGDASGWSGFSLRRREA